METAIPAGVKGWPPEAEGMSGAAVATAGWRVLDGTMPFPVAVLKESALAHNVALMRDYCDRHGVRLAPHGKTTMAPALFARQLAAGAWGLTAATPVHLRLYRRLGVRRIVYANQLVEPSVIRWLASELAADPELELYSLVDSPEAVRLLDRVLTAAAAVRPLPVLVELGMTGARTGCRTAAAALAVAREVVASDRLALAGIEAFEGLAADVRTVDRLLDEVEAAYAAMGPMLPADAFITAGGSAYFDRVVARFADCRLVLRSGCYVVHDTGLYARESALDGRAASGVSKSGRLRNALEVWSVVLSRPEPTLAITSMGKRDVGNDAGLPTPTLTCGAGDEHPRPLAAEVTALNDQHAHLRVPASAPLAVGDLVGATVSHPCTTLDKWRVLALVDDDYRVLDAVHTYF
ncbi:MAG: alanine racemase [Micromonosporaceae bacterium]